MTQLYDWHGHGNPECSICRFIQENGPDYIFLHLFTSVEICDGLLDQMKANIQELQLQNMSTEEIKNYYIEQYVNINK